MKKLLICLAVILPIIFIGIQAQAAGKTIVFAWEQVIADDMGGWNLHYGLVAGNPTESVNIPYTSCDMSKTPPVCQAPTAIKVIEGGDEAKYYFMMSAYDTQGNVSPYSNEVPKDLDFLAPTAPVIISITIPLVP